MTCQFSLLVHDLPPHQVNILSPSPTRSRSGGGGVSPLATPCNIARAQLYKFWNGQHIKRTWKYQKWTLSRYDPQLIRNTNKDAISTITKQSQTQTFLHINANREKTTGGSESNPKKAQLMSNRDITTPIKVLCINSTIKSL